MQCSIAKPCTNLDEMGAELGQPSIGNKWHIQGLKFIIQNNLQTQEIKTSWYLCSLLKVYSS